jgi:hypothetical protein
VGFKFRTQWFDIAGTFNEQVVGRRGITGKAVLFNVLVKEISFFSDVCTGVLQLIQVPECCKGK